MAKRMLMKSAVFEHFTITTDGKYYLCQCVVGGDSEKVCEAKISSYTSCEKNPPTRASNLKRHLQRFHPKVLEAVLERDRNNHISFPSTSKLEKKWKFSGGQTQLSKLYASDKVTITMTSEKFKNHIVEMVVKNNLPLSLFSQPAFLGLNGEMAMKLGVSLERENIKRLVIEEAKYKKEQLRKSLKRRFVFIKMDACTHHGVNYFAIHVRFVEENKKMITQMLGVKDIQAPHSSERLQKFVEEVLEDFEIRNEQVLSVVTDNASNVINAIEKTSKADDEQIQDDIPANSPHRESSEILDDVVEEAFKLFPIQHARCAMQTLRLAIRDGLKAGPAASLIDKLRLIAVSARTPKIDAVLQRCARKGAILDQAKCWESTYLMIKRLLKLRTFLEDLDNENVSLTEGQWAQVSQLESLLCHPFAITKKLQSEDLTPGRFLLEWKRLIYCLDKSGGLIADGIVTSMKTRERLLLDNQILLAAVYIDPMNRILLNSEQIAKGREGLYEVAMRMKGLQVLPAIPRLLDKAAGCVANSESSTSNEELDFEAYLDKMEYCSKIKRCRLYVEEQPVDVHVKKFQQDFLNGLKDVEKHDRSLKLTVEEVIPAYPEIIGDVARNVTAMPSTQVTAERLFSVLKIIESDLWASMKEDLAEAILFLRTNGCGAGYQLG